MAAGADVSGETVVELSAVKSSSNPDPAENVNSDVSSESLVSNGCGQDSNSNSKPDHQMEKIVSMLKKLKLNPLAKEFFPSSYGQYHNWDQFAVNNFVLSTNKNLGNDNDEHPNSRGFNIFQRSNYNQGRRQTNEKALRARRKDSVKRTVYVSDIDHNITEERLAAVFSGYGRVLDCRICGDPNSRLRFAFVEFDDEYSAKAALNLGGTMLGFSAIRVSPSKTAILPVNPTFLPRSDDEKEMCARTVYCTNIDKKVSQTDVQNFFETRCGEVSRLRLLGDQVHSTRIAFIEFAMAESAILALDNCGELLGSERIRVSPSKTPVRPRISRAVVV